jgi:hypothetical protein
MKKLLTCMALSILVFGCQTTTDVKRSQLDRDTIYDTQLDSKTRLEVRLDQDGTTRVHLLRDGDLGEVVSQFIYSPADDSLDSVHRLQYDKGTNGLAGGVLISSQSGRLKRISLVEFRGTNCYLYLNKEGGLLPNTRRVYSIELDGSTTQRETIRHEFIPSQADETENE